MNARLTRNRNVATQTISSRGSIVVPTALEPSDSLRWSEMKNQLNGTQQY